MAAPLLKARPFFLNRSVWTQVAPCLCAPVVVAGHDDHRVQMRMIQREGGIEQIVESDAGGDGFEPEGFRPLRQGVGVHPRT